MRCSGSWVAESPSLTKGRAVRAWLLAPADAAWCGEARVPLVSGAVLALTHHAHS